MNKASRDDVARALTDLTGASVTEMRDNLVSFDRRTIDIRSRVVPQVISNGRGITESTTTLVGKGLRREGTPPPTPAPSAPSTVMLVVHEGELKSFDVHGSYIETIPPSA